MSQTSETTWIFLPNNLVIISTPRKVSILVAPKITDENKYISFVAYNGSDSKLNSDTSFVFNTDGSVTSKSNPQMGLSCDAYGRITFDSNVNAWLKCTQPLWSDVSNRMQ